MRQDLSWAFARSPGPRSRANRPQHGETTPEAPGVTGPGCGDQPLYQELLYVTPKPAHRDHAVISSPSLEDEMDSLILSLTCGFLPLVAQQ
jgi:hypothetical protein